MEQKVEANLVEANKGFDFPDEGMEAVGTMEGNPEEKTIPIVEPLTRQCISCGRDFTISPAEQRFYTKKGFVLPKKCPECRKRKNITQVFTCKDCNKEFKMTNNEISFFKNHGYEVPKRCPECRAFRKASNEK